MRIKFEPQREVPVICTPCTLDNTGVPRVYLEIVVCACCKVCALSEKSPCGVHTPPCASQLSCTPQHVHFDHDDHLDDVIQLLNGQGVCLPSQRGQFNYIAILLLNPH